MSVCNYTVPINGYDCIGDSRSTINQNFANLDNAVCALSSTGVTVADTTTIDLTFNTATRLIQADVKPLSITASELATNSVERLKIKNGNVTNDKLAFDGGSFGFKNKIINGSFEVWQRGNSFTSANYFTADRFLVTRGGGAIGSGSTDIDVTRVTTSLPVYTTDNETFANGIKLQRVSGTTNTQTIRMMYIAESADIISLQGRSVTLSFFVKRGSNFTSTDLKSNIYTGIGINEGASLLQAGTWSGINFQASSVIPVALNWQRATQTVTIPGNATELGIIIEYTPPTGAAGVDESLYITGMQLELGDTVTPFEHKPRGYELGLCQRYFEKSYDADQAPSTSASSQCIYGTVVTASTTFYNTGGGFSVRKFKTPVISIYTPSGGSSSIGKFVDTSGSTYTVSSVNSTETRITSINSTVSLTVGKIIQWHYTADAEIV